MEQGIAPRYQAALSLPGLPASVGEARAYAAACLPAGFPRAHDLVLVVSELATNAVLHSASGMPGGTFEVLVDVEPGAVAVAVLDQGATLTPALRSPGEHGRGLGIVGALVDAYEVTTGESGRCTWCRLDWSPAPAQARTEARA